MDGATTSGGRITNNLYTLSRIYVKTKKRLDEKQQHTRSHLPSKISPHRKLPPLMRHLEGNRAPAPVEDAFDADADIYWEPPPHAAAAHRRLGDIGGRPARRVAYGESAVAPLDGHGRKFAAAAGAADDGDNAPLVRPQQTRGDTRRRAAVAKQAPAMRRQARVMWAEVVRKIVVQQRVVGAFLSRSSVDAAHRRTSWASIVQKLRICADDSSAAVAAAGRTRRTRGTDANGHRRGAHIGGAHIGGAHAAGAYNTDWQGELHGSGGENRYGDSRANPAPQQRSYYGVAALGQPHLAYYARSRGGFEQRVPPASLKGVRASEAGGDRYGGHYTGYVYGYDEAGHSRPPWRQGAAHAPYGAAAAGAIAASKPAPMPLPKPPPAATKLQHRFAREMTLVNRVNASELVDLQITGFATPRYAAAPVAVNGQSPSHRAGARHRPNLAGESHPSDPVHKPAGEQDDRVPNGRQQLHAAKPPAATVATDYAAASGARQRAALAARLRSRTKVHYGGNTLQVPQVSTMPQKALLAVDHLPPPQMQQNPAAASLLLLLGLGATENDGVPQLPHAADAARPYLVGSPEPRRRLGSPAPRRFGSPPPAGDSAGDGSEAGGEITLLVPDLPRIGVAAAVKEPPSQGVRQAHSPTLTIVAGVSGEGATMAVDATVASDVAASAVDVHEPVVIITDAEGQSMSAAAAEAEVWPNAATSTTIFATTESRNGRERGSSSSATEDRESGYLSAPSSKLSERSKSRNALSRLSTITSSSGGFLEVPFIGVDSRAHSPALSTYSEVAAPPSRSVSRFSALTAASSSSRFLEVPSINLADMDAPQKSRFPAINVSASQTDLASNAESDTESITIPLPVIPRLSNVSGHFT